MPFNSFTFALFVFAVLIIYALQLPGIVRKCKLFTASYLFYAAWHAFSCSDEVRISDRDRKHFTEALSS